MFALPQPLTEAERLVKHRQGVGRGCPNYARETSFPGIGFWAPILMGNPIEMWDKEGMFGAAKITPIFFINGGNSVLLSSMKLLHVGDGVDMMPIGAP